MFVSMLRCRTVKTVNAGWHLDQGHTSSQKATESLFVSCYVPISSPYV